MKKRASTLTTPYFLGAISGCVFLFGLMAFVTVLNTGPGISSRKEIIVELIQANAAKAATAPVTQAPATPMDAATQGCDYASNPLTIAEKAEMAPKLSSALGPLNSKWKLRSLKRADEQISGMITYHRSSSARPEGKIATVPAKPDMYSVIFRAGPPNHSWRGKTTHGNFEVSTRRFTDEMRTHLPNLELYLAQLDGDVPIYLASNTDRATSMSVLENLDIGLIHALVAPVPKPQDQAIAELAARKTILDVPSEAALREQDAAPRPRGRIG